jgi:hypothetical protein
MLTLGSLTTVARPLTRLTARALSVLHVLHSGRFFGGGMLSRAALAVIAAARALLIPGEAARLMQAELTWSDLWPRPGARRPLGVAVATHTEMLGAGDTTCS